MSVDFTTIVGYGYMLTWDEVERLEAKNPDIWDYIYCANGYCDTKETDYFFGIVLKTVACGSYITINDLVIGEAAIDTARRLVNLLTDFGLTTKGRWSTPDVCVINRVH